MVKILPFLICSIKAFDPSSRPKCYVTGQAVEGWNQINSPGYPNAFPGRLECLYVLTAPPGEKIELLFEKFEMDPRNNPGCKNQGLAILDPAQSRVPGQTEIFCGSTPPAPFKSRGNKLFLKLESNIKQQGEGWLIKYRIKQSGMDMSGPGGSPGGGGPSVDVFGNPRGGPKAGPKGGPKSGPKSPPKSPKKPAGKANAKPQGRPNVKQIIAEMAAASAKTGQKPKLKMSNKGRSGGNGQQPARMYQDCQPGWKPGMPCSQKATKQLGSKSDLETKKLLKNLGLGVGIAGACVVVWLAFRHFTGATNGGIPEPEHKLPEGKIPTHVQAIMDHKAKMKAEGKEYEEDSD